MGDRTVTPRRRAGAPKVRLVVIGLVVVIGAAWITRSLRPTSQVTDGVAVGETDATEPPPDVQEPRTEAERIQRLLEILFSGDPDDAVWARFMLERAGEPARAEVADAARRCVRSNRAFTGHALDVLLLDPRPGDLPLALEAIDSPDIEVIRRAMLMIARIGGPAAHEAIQRIADVAKFSWPVPLWTLEALVALGGEDAVAQIERVATSPDFLEGAQEQALASLGMIGGERARAVLRREFAAATSETRIISAAQGLVSMGDATPIPKLRELLAEKGDDRALNLLARANDDAAFAEIEKRLRAPIESDARLAQGLALLGHFPFARRAALLRLVAAAGRPRDIRVTAWAQLVQDGEPSEADDVRRLLRSEGTAAKEDRYVAALVLSRLHDAATVQALLAAEKANRDDHELRAILLRALAMTGAPEAAETVVRAIAADPAEHGDNDSLAFQVWQMVPAAAPAFRAAAAPFVRQALEGGLGPLGGSAKLHVILMASTTCGPEIGPLVEPYLTDENRHLRAAAATAVVNIAGPTTAPALRNAWWRKQDPYTRMDIARSLRRVVLIRPVR